MKHSITTSGFLYRIRPVDISDAQFIIDVRLEDKERNRYIHEISDDVELQKKWIENYLKREGDYYFVVENMLTGEKEGLIGIYNISNNKAEWGRWVIKKDSFAALESVSLVYKTGFEKLGLDELYTRTIENNEQVVNFHKNINAKFRAQLINEVELNGNKYNVIEQYVDKNYYFDTIKNELEDKCFKIFQRNLKHAIGDFEFHHIGVAVKSIKKEFEVFSLLGYKKEDYFEKDELQGVKGLFITAKNQPRIELLENLENSHTLDYFVENKIKMYHFGYLVSDIEKCFDIFVNKLRAKVVSEMKKSSYFKQNRICFLMLKNMFIIELIESKRD